MFFCFFTAVILLSPKQYFTSYNNTTFFKALRIIFILNKIYIAVPLSINFLLLKSDFTSDNILTILLSPKKYFISYNHTKLFKVFRILFIFNKIYSAIPLSISFLCSRTILHLITVLLYYYFPSNSSIFYNHTKFFKVFRTLFILNKIYNAIPLSSLFLLLKNDFKPDNLFNIDSGMSPKQINKLKKVTKESEFLWQVMYVTSKFIAFILPSIYKYIYIYY